MGFLLKIHESSSGTVVAVCDEDIVGRMFLEGDLVLDVDADFFGGQSASVDEVIRAIGSASSVNVAGSFIVEELLGAGVISLSGVKMVDNVKFAHIYRL